jgi:hypothetical protein
MHGTINFNWFKVHAFEDRIDPNEYLKECLFIALTYIYKKITKRKTTAIELMWAKERKLIITNML